mgnify:CR=1 FL=1
MATYVYETIPDDPNQEPRRFEVMQKMSEPALTKDPKFKPWVELYARDQDAFFRDFASAYGKLLGMSMLCQ